MLILFVSNFLPHAVMPFLVWRFYKRIQENYNVESQNINVENCVSEKDVQYGRAGI